MKLLVLAILAFPLPLFVDTAFADDPCLPKDDDCSFYRECLEAKYPCGESGYALGYGEAYCNRFKDQFEGWSSDLSNEAKDWRKATTLCLQEKLLENLDTLEGVNYCSEIRKAAFEDHASCYTQPEHSICDLKLIDLEIIKFQVLKFKDLFLSAEALRQMHQVKMICITQLADKCLDGWAAWEMWDF